MKKMTEIKYGSLPAYRTIGRFGQTAYVLEYKIPLENNPFWDEKDKWVVFIPKTGSQSLEWSLDVKYNFGHMFASQFPSRIHHKIVAFVRNPYDRLVSSYEFMVRGGFNQNPQYFEIRDKYKDFQDWVLTGLNSYLLKIQKDRPFEGWKEAFLPQHYWITKDNVLLIPKENIGRFENLKDDVYRLLNIELKLHMNKSENKKDWKTYYTNPAVAEKVYELYRQDFDLFNYPKEI